jgi:tetratricopeptide (TPR) repeat protein
MSERHEQDGAGARASAVRSARRRDAALAAAVVAGLLGVYALSQWLDARRPPEDPFLTYEETYVTPEAARRMSLGFNGLLADWYWLRSLQYVGRKMDAYKERFTLDDMSPLGIKNLGALLDRATTLDPDFMAAYEFGAVVLPAVDRDAAVRLVEKGIRDNPREWRLYHHLGYINWRAGRYREAADAYRAGSRVEGAPNWMAAMAARVELDGGARDVARELYRRMYEDSGDEQVKTLAAKRLAQIDSLDERDLIRRVLSDFRARAGRCPSSWREAAPLLRAAGLRTDGSGAPVDPTDLPYVLDPAACEVDLDPRSEVPKK